jgi:preprotein translocase subunit SecA
LYHRNVEYVIKDGEIIIVDEFTGRLMSGRRWSDGLHQAIEVKENLKIKNENQTLATITFQNFFRMYKKISGMTGTASTESAEFWEIYKLGIVVVPTNNPMIRKDYPDVIYRTENEKYDAIINEIESLYRKGQPVLVGTRSIEKSEKIAAILRKKGILLQVLNAKYHELEAQIISGAGIKCAVTIATNMAGRGTDIVLGGGDVIQNKEVKKLGGLHIIGTERHESRRIDNQLRGRAGRQGDPGSSRFFLSMEDELMRLFGSDRMSMMMQKLGLKEGESIQHTWISRAIEGAQRKVEEMNFDIRKQLIDFDNVMNKQRETIYKLRSEVLESNDISDVIRDMINELIGERLAAWATGKYVEIWDWVSINAWLFRIFSIKYEVDNKNRVNYLTRESAQINIAEKIFKIYERRREELTSKLFSHIERMILLQMIDSSWRDHLYELDQLRRGIGFRAYAQKDPKVEYQKESFILFESMMKRIAENTIEYVFKTKIDVESEGIINPHLNRNINGDKINEFILRDLNKIGRNDPCPCGSGKKYKRCCYA